VLSIESARGVLNAYEMAIAAERVVSLAFGGAQDGDLNADLGCTWSLDGPEMLHARQHTLLAARAARIDTPLDGVFADVRDAAGFERDTDLSRRLGYRGRKLIHPSQIEPCNRLYAPSEAELDYYARVLDAFEKAVAQGRASTIVDGRMIDLAMANAARRVIEAAKYWCKANSDNAR
jgi:citrate lyase subunit beta/citryl-CoA lyase